MWLQISLLFDVDELEEYIPLSAPYNSSAVAKTQDFDCRPSLVPIVIDLNRRTIKVSEPVDVVNKWAIAIHVVIVQISAARFDRNIYPQTMHR